MTDSKSSEIKVREDNPTGVTSRAHGANVDAVGFNISFIASKNPTLALKIMKLYDEAHKLQPDDPSYPEEDYSAANDALQKYLTK